MSACNLRKLDIVGEVFQDIFTTKLVKNVKSSFMEVVMEMEIILNTLKTVQNYVNKVKFQWIHILQSILIKTTYSVEGKIKHF